MRNRTSWLFAGSRLSRSQTRPASRGSLPITDSGVLTLFRGHHVDIARHERHLITPALGARRFHSFMLGDGLGAFKLLAALLATIVVGWHRLEPNERGGLHAFYGG